MTFEIKQLHCSILGSNTYTNANILVKHGIRFADREIYNIFFQGVRKEVAIKGNWYWQRIRICKAENNRHFYELVI